MGEVRKFEQRPKKPSDHGKLATFVYRAEPDDEAGTDLSDSEMVFALYKRGNAHHPRSFGVAFREGLSSEEFNFMIFVLRNELGLGKIEPF